MMKEYIKPEMEYVTFATEKVTAVKLSTETGEEGDII